VVGADVLQPAIINPVNATKRISFGLIMLFPSDGPGEAACSHTLPRLAAKPLNGLWGVWSHDRCPHARPSGLTLHHAQHFSIKQEILPMNDLQKPRKSHLI
jgi:hypothetical protein